MLSILKIKISKENSKRMGLTILVFFFNYPLLANTLLPSIIIKDCYDGDTCTTIEGEKIRLACIDTPELKGKNADPTSAKEARDFLNDLIANQMVTIRRITKDRYGRTVAELYKNNINIQETIIKKGYGKIYEKYADQCDWI